MSALTPTPTGDQSTNGKTRVQEFNGLGQLKSVCEVNTYTDKAACGQTIAANGYVTNYGYDALGHLTSVAQGAQTRTFYYDGVNRLTKEINPENGTTTYTYDSDTTHCAGFTNLPGDPSSIVYNSQSFKCFSYDKLHRKITETDSDGFSRGFVWDTATIPGINLGNPVGQKGQLAEAYTCVHANCNTGTSAIEAFLYDNRGIQSQYFQYSPNSNGPYQAYTTYDAVGNLALLAISDTTGTAFPTTTVSAYDAEGRPTQIKADSSVMATASYGVFGLSSILYGTSDSDSFSYDALGHMSLFRYNVGSNYNQGIVNWNANGTLAVSRSRTPFPAATVWLTSAAAPSPTTTMISLDSGRQATTTQDQIEQMKHTQWIAMATIG